MSQADYAIVVGISNYPELGEPPDARADLKGPEVDAAAVRAWLVDRDGGDVPEDHVQCITSGDFPVSATARGAKPTQEMVAEAFRRLHDIAQANSDKGLGLGVGRRLYVYMSGHGFSPRPSRGCLFMADATKDYGANFAASDWLDWFQDSGYFREFVLWLDCCMDRGTIIPPGPVPFAPKAAPLPPGPGFIGFAAQRPLRAVERELPDEDPGKVHGVFTWVLLEGLRGAAADAYAKVTGRSLADWVRNAMHGRLEAADAMDMSVALEPEIMKEDPGLVFRRGVPARTYPVTLLFPGQAATFDAEIWSGRPPTPRILPVAGGTLRLDLVPGLYLVAVPGLGLRQGLEVVGPASFAVTLKGPPVAQPVTGAPMTVNLDCNHAETENFLIDERFGLVDRASGSLCAGLPFGLYKAKTRLGRDVAERVFLLDAGNLQLGDLVPQRVTAAPLPGAVTSHEYHEMVVAGAASANLESRTGPPANVTIMARAWSPEGVESPADLPFGSLALVDRQGKLVADILAHGSVVSSADLQAQGQPKDNSDPYALFAGAQPPGTYYLRQELLPGRLAEQTLIVPPGLAVDAYLLRVVSGRDKARPGPPRMSIATRPLSAPPLGAPDAAAMETALVALTDERRILSPGLKQTLLHDSSDPIAGIIGGHLLLIEAERTPGTNIDALNGLVERLRSLVNGQPHSDIEALSLRCPDQRLRGRAALPAPPMFRRSWQIVVAESQRNPKLIPLGLWRRVRAQTSIGPWFAWLVDHDAKAAIDKALLQALAPPRSAPPSPAAAPMGLETAVELPRSAATGGRRPPRAAARAAPRSPPKDVSAQSGAQAGAQAGAPSGAQAAAQAVDREVGLRMARQLGMPQAAVDALLAKHGRNGRGATRRKPGR